MPCPGLLPGGLRLSAGREKDASFAVHLSQREGTPRSRGRLKHARRRLTTEAAVKDAQNRPALVCLKASANAVIGSAVPERFVKSVSKSTKLPSGEP